MMSDEFSPLPPGLSGTVRRRLVFYVPGYDPFHPRRYRELYRRESAEQARISGYEIAIAARRKPAATEKSAQGTTGAGAHGWHVTSAQDGLTTETDIEVLVWSDIVRGSMGASIPATYMQLLRTAWAYIGSGALFRLMRLRKGPVIAALYPIAVLLAEALAGILLGTVIALALLWPLPEFTGKGLVGAAIAAAVLVAVLRWFRRHDNRIYAYYLMHDYAFTAHWGGANPERLETRIAEFGNRIAAALGRDDLDEVLVVGHSSGAHLAVSVLADLVRDGRVPATGPRLSLLTLGQVVPMVSFLPGAARLRAALQRLGSTRALDWVDVTAPGGGCAFALCDPVAVSGVALPDQCQPLILSAAFSQTLSPERHRALRRRYFKMHFQYLCAFDRPGDYDYFRITAGPRTLGARMAHRRHSKSRLATPVNRYTSIE